MSVSWFCRCTRVCPWTSGNLWKLLPAGSRPPSSGSGALEDPRYADGTGMLQCRSSRSWDVAERFEVHTVRGRSVICMREAQRLFVLHVGQEDVCSASWQTQAIRFWSSKVGQEDATRNLEIGSLARAAGPSLQESLVKVTDPLTLGPQRSAETSS